MPRFRGKRGARLTNMPGRCSGQTWARSTWNASARLRPRTRPIGNGCPAEVCAPRTVGVGSANSCTEDKTLHVRDGIALAHLDCLTDATGLIQHAIYSIPRRESGYTTDDNARALRLCARLWGRHPDERMLRRVTGYLSFLEFARCPGGGFHNFMSYQRAW